MFQQFLKSGRRYFTVETGAITVDWVVLTAAVIGMGIMIISVVWQGAEIFAVDLNANVEKIKVVE